MKETKLLAKAKYDGMTIEQLCELLNGRFANMRESQREFYEILFYLQTTSRYKELPGYKKSSFWQFIEDNFNIRKGTFMENIKAWTRYPEIAADFGTGLVTKIERMCGAAKIPKVAAEIRKERDGHKKPLPRARIETIIQSFRKQQNEVKKEITDWKSMYEREAAAHEKTKNALRSAMAEIHSLNDQIARLKRTAETFVEVREILDRHNHAIRTPEAAMPA